MVEQGFLLTQQNISSFLPNRQPPAGISYFFILRNVHETGGLDPVQNNVYTDDEEVGRGRMTRLKTAVWGLFLLAHLDNFKKGKYR